MDRLASLTQSISISCCAFSIDVDRLCWVSKLCSQLVSVFIVCVDCGSPRTWLHCMLHDRQYDARMTQRRRNAKMTQCKDIIVQDGLGLNSCVVVWDSNPGIWSSHLRLLTCSSLSPCGALTLSSPSTPIITLWLSIYSNQYYCGYVFVYLTNVAYLSYIWWPIFIAILVWLAVCPSNKIRATLFLSVQYNRQTASSYVILWISISVLNKEASSFMESSIYVVVCSLGTYVVSIIERSSVKWRFRDLLQENRALYCLCKNIILMVHWVFDIQVVDSVYNVCSI